MSGLNVDAIGAIVIAAGRSTRMGSDKLLLDYQGKPVLAHAVDAAIGAGMSVLVVTSEQSCASHRKALEGRRVKFATVDSTEARMSHSIAVGIGHLPASCRAAIIALGDMPLVSTGLYQALAAHASEEAVVIPEYLGRRGNPVLWGRNHFPLLSGLTGDVGGRRLFDGLGHAIIPLLWYDDSIHVDIDTPEQYQALIDRMA